MSTRSRFRGDTGSATLELAILAPALLVLLGLIIVAGRVEIAGGVVQQASAAASREASLARTPAAAQQAADRAARDTFADQDLHCSQLDVTIDTTGFTVPVGQVASVSAQVRCTVDLSDAAVPGLPGSRTLTARSDSALDRYRSR